MVSVKNISKSFNNIKAVNDLSFDVNEGEIVGLLGPNGAGKSTTMRVMSGYLSPDSGDVEVNGFSIIQNATEAQKTLGYLPENNPVYKDMLVGEFLELSASLKGVEKAKLKENLNFVVPSVNIAEVFYRPISELSKGFKQRVGIAAALIHKPELLIMDEPTEGLDPNQRAEIRKLIKELSKKHTIIISTHVMQEVEAVCSRMIIINQGKKVADGSVEELSANAKNEKTLNLKLQGNNIENKIKALSGIKELVIKSVLGDTSELALILDKNTAIQPDLSQLIRDNKWIVWDMHEEKQLLEDIFKKLTQSQN